MAKFRAPNIVLNLKDAVDDPVNAGAIVLDAYLQLDRFDANPAKLLMTWMSDPELRKQFPNI